MQHRTKTLVLETGLQTAGGTGVKGTWSQKAFHLPNVRTHFISRVIYGEDVWRCSGSLQCAVYFALLEQQTPRYWSDTTGTASQRTLHFQIHRYSLAREHAPEEQFINQNYRTGPSLTKFSRGLSKA